MPSTSNYGISLVNTCNFCLTSLNHVLEPRVSWCQSSTYFQSYLGSLILLKPKAGITETGRKKYSFLDFHGIVSNGRLVKRELNTIII